MFCLFVCFLSFLSSSLFFSENRGEKEHFYLCKVHLKNGRGLRELPLSGALETTGTRLSRVFSGNVRKTIGLQRKKAHHHSPREIILLAFYIFKELSFLQGTFIKWWLFWQEMQTFAQF